MKNKIDCRGLKPGIATDSDQEAPATPSSGATRNDRQGMLDRDPVSIQKLPEVLRTEADLFQGTDGHTYLWPMSETNEPVLRVGTAVADAYVRQVAREYGRHLRSGELRDVNAFLSGDAGAAGDVRAVWLRVAPMPGGCEIDLADADNRYVRVTADGVSISNERSGTLFRRTPTMRALPMPVAQGDLGLLDRYVNLHVTVLPLLKGWLTFTLAHAKQPQTSYPILLLHGEQGTGKSLLCRVLQSLVDPHSVTLQTFPRSERDLAIAAQQAHVLLYDNLREVSASMSDRLCTASTGGSFTTRRLYCDDEQIAMTLHIALVLNGIVPFVQQPDLAQRCLPLNLQPLDESARRDEATFIREFERDRPVIFRGVLDYISAVYKHLPAAEVSNPERMLDYVRWLAAMERVEGVRPGAYQTAYSSALSTGMRDALLDDPLAVAVLELIDAEPTHRWSGTPSELLDELDDLARRRTIYSRDWPANASALSKRLLFLQAGLRRQGIDVQLRRGKHRQILITRLEGYRHD